MDDLVSVIVPIYNSEKYLKECLDSIVNQTYKNLEIILVDDGSTDASGTICDEYAVKDDRIKAIHKANGGNGDARNTGLGCAAGEWIVMSDNDDVMHCRQIEVLLTVAKEKHADIAVGWYKAFDNICDIPDNAVLDEDIRQAEILSERHLNDDSFVRKYSMILTVPWSKIYRKNVFNGVQYPPKSRHDDTATTWKLYENADRVAFVDIPLHFWRNNQDSFGRRAFDETHFDAMDAYAEQLEYYKGKKRQRYVEIIYAEYLEAFFWCYNRMIEVGMQLESLFPYYDYLKKNVHLMKISSNMGFRQWLRYRYLMYYKIPKIIGEKDD